MYSQLPFEQADPAHTDFQYLEDLATGYWYSQVLFTALKLDLFNLIEQGYCDLSELASAARCQETPLSRFMQSLKSLQLVQETESGWINSQMVRLYLLPEARNNLTDFLLYREYMQKGWSRLFESLVQDGRQEPALQPPKDDYARRICAYLRSTDSLARCKAAEIVQVLDYFAWQPPILDVGGGAGSLSRAILAACPKAPDCRVTLVELSEVIQAAGDLYPHNSDWQGITCLAGDFRSVQFAKSEKFGLILLSNFLHAYSPAEAEQLLQKCSSLLAENGLILVHDYFPDCQGRSAQKGTLYDLNMLCNTYNGECHAQEKVCQWLKKQDLNRVKTLNLKTDTSLILASRVESGTFETQSPCFQWPAKALQLGFKQAAFLPASEVLTGTWVQAKCRFGCARYGESLQCPPYAMPVAETRQMLAEYQQALLIEGSPPGADFHQKLLNLERRAFLDGYPKAFVFGAGPCPVCPTCPSDGKCRFPDQARPAMEAAGIDVYGTAQKAGFALSPVQDKGHYVKYLGLLLLE